jgi:hypothetical protein
MRLSVAHHGARMLYSWQPLMVLFELETNFYGGHQGSQAGPEAKPWLRPEKVTQGPEAIGS